MATITQPNDDPSSHATTRNISAENQLVLSLILSKFDRLESIIDTKLAEFNESLKNVNARIDDMQKQVRKLVREKKHLDSATSASGTVSSPSLNRSDSRSSDTGSLKIKSHRKLSTETKHAAIAESSEEPLSVRANLFSLFDNEHFPSFKAGAKVLQPYFKAKLQKQNYKKMLEQKEIRSLVAKELYDTEVNYVHTLKTIQTIFMEPLLAAADSDRPILNKAEIREVFGQIPVFYGINSEFLKLLTPLMKSWNPVTTQLGTVFIGALAHFLKLYGANIEQYTLQFSHIKSLLSKNADFAKFVTQAEQHPDCKLQDLPLMMLTAVQRVTRYQILLTSLLKATWPGHIDYANLTIAIQKVSETTQMVNEKKRETENLNRLGEIASQLQGIDEAAVVASHRRYISELEATRYPKSTKMIMYLFNDGLLITKVTGDEHIMKQFAGLEGCRMAIESDSKRLKVDCPLHCYYFEVEDLSKQNAFFEQFNTTKQSFMQKQASDTTVNPRSMFNYYRSSTPITDTLNAYRRRPSSLGRSASQIDSSATPDQVPASFTFGTVSSPSSHRKPLKKSPTSIDVAKDTVALESPKSQKMLTKAEKRKSFRT